MMSDPIRPGPSLSEPVAVTTDGERYYALTQYTGRTIAESDSLDTVLDETLAASASPSIELGPGIFTLDATLHLPSGTRLRGSGTSATKLLNRDGESPAVLVLEQVSDVSVSDLKVSAGHHTSPAVGLQIARSVSCSITNVVVVGFQRHGIELRSNSRFCRVAASTAAGNGEANIFLADLAGEPDGDFGVNTLTGLTIYGGGSGIVLDRALTVNIVGCTVNQTSGTGFHLRNKSNSALITACRTFQISGDAVRVEDSHELNITANIFCWHEGRGIAVKDANWGLVSGNEVIDSGSFNPGTPDLQTRIADLDEAVPHVDAVRLENVAGFAVTGNTIFNWGVVPALEHGVFEDDNSSNNIIANNNVNYFRRSEVRTAARSLASANLGFGRDPHQDQPIAPAGEVLQSFVVEDLVREIDAMK